MTILQAATPTPALSPKQATVASRIIHRIRASGETGGPFSKRRPEGTLKATIGWDPGNKKEGIPPALKSGAMLFYRNQVVLPDLVGKPQANMGIPAYGALAVALAFPTLRQDKTPTKHARKVFKKIWTSISKAWTEKAIQNTVSVRKNDDSFSVKMPVFYASTGVLEGLRDFYASPQGGQPVDWTIEQDAEKAVEVQRAPAPFLLRPGKYTIDQIPVTGGPFDRYIAWLKQATNAFIQVEKVAGSMGESFIFFLCLDFTQQEATVLCQTSWLEIRPIDFYSLMYTWALGRANTAKSAPPIYSIPLSRIARELPPGAPTRLSEDLGIMVDEKSDYWWIEDRNNISSFESSYAKHLTRKDGSLSAISFEGPEDRPAPAPSSGLVFVDWVNLKMSFVNDTGRMEIIGLDRGVPANATHYVRILKARAVEGLGASIITKTMSLATSLGGNFPNWKDLSDTISQILALPESLGQMAIDFSIQDLYNVRFRISAANEFIKAIDLVLSYAATSVENLYSRFSYRTISHLIAHLKIIQAYAPKYDEVTAKDRERRKAYINQDKLPEDDGLEAAPYMSEPGEDGTGGRALMPHQRRNAHRLASSPNFAILAVDAGGGKTATCIYDFLKEMGKGNVRRGLIMCPAHLVAQYVKEFLYFTNSRVNVIAVNTYTLNRHKIAGMASLLEKAPPNTVVVTDYNLALGIRKSPSMGYGPVTTKYYPIVEMLRSFMFDYVFCDESHYLKGATGRSAAASRLISDIPYKRLASGTLTPNRVTDLINQINLLDPTILPRASFLDKYALEFDGDRVKKWKEGFERELMADLKQHVVWCQTKRKEWAALLPSFIEDVKWAHMTPNQQAVYRTILNEVVEKLAAEAKKNKALRGLLSGQVEKDPDADTEDEEGDEGSDVVDIDSMLRPHLSRLEQFVVAPSEDIYGGTVLQGDDLRSPKVEAIATIIREHLDAGIPGKILIFTNLKKSAKAIYEQLPPDLQAKTIHYTAANKEADAANFERNPNKQIMVGVEISMNTGLNLQFCSRLIRVDSVWTPGSLEQGNSRIQRPNVKQVENRTKVYLDWVTCANSIDVAKQAYLLQKQVAIGKFEEGENPNFDHIQVPDPFSLTLDLIRTCDQGDEEVLFPYYDAYRTLKMATAREWALYKEQHPEDIDPVTKAMKMTPVSRAPNQPGAALMYRVPYVPGTELYKAEDLGLVRYDSYMGLDESDLEEGEDEAEETEEQAAASRIEIEKVRGLAVHTEYGDGNIVGVSRTGLRVQLASGARIGINKLSAFIITRAQTNNKDQRELLLRQVGDLPFDKPFDLDVPDPRDIKIPKNDESAPDDRISVNLYLRVSNDIVGLEMNNAKENPRGAAALEAFGFQQPAPYIYAEMPTAQHMLKQFKAWHAAGFRIHSESNEACKTLYVNLSNSRKNAATMIGQAQAADLRNFYRIQRKPDPDRTMLYPYPLIEDDTLYLALPLTGHPASQQARRVKVAGVTWDEVDVEDYRVVYMKSLNALDTNMPKLLKQGLVVSNIKDLIKRRKKLQVRHGDILSK